MEIKFWPRYLFAVLIGFSGIYYATAQMSDVPFVLSDSQMEQLAGADTYAGWRCKENETLQRCLVYLVEP